ncbi:hypothetical protein [Deinococcus misasensis]|uniref:hypothetical protein n=1 Tax=Deinococcus misasensis TaxID=392413 RepID=UPI00054E22FF|nr:hypothetical protein [Deinococcus misasensis]
MKKSKNERPYLYRQFIVFLSLGAILWYVQWPFSFDSHFPLTAQDQQKACLKEVKRKFSVPITILDVGVGEHAWNDFRLKPEHQGAVWVATARYTTDSGEIKNQFFRCEVWGDHPLLAKVEVQVPSR